MSGKERARRTVDIGEAHELFGSKLAQIERGDVRVILQQNGKDVVAVISAYDLERLEMLDRRAAEGFKAVEEVWARNADLDPDEVEQDIAEAIAEMRAEARRNASATPPR
jgi:hypothetical protein